MSPFTRLSALALACLGAACATIAEAPEPALTGAPAAFTALSADEQRGFLAAYPALSSEERQALLDLVADGGRPSEFLRSRGSVQGIYSDDGRLVARPELYAVAGIEITASPESPADLGGVTRGTELPLRAALRYRDGRLVDVTTESSWHALPDLAAMAGNTLKFDCASTDIEVAATFLGSWTGRRTVSIRKKVAAVELAWAPGFETGPSGGFRALRATARCEDGSTADVTCRGQWSVTGAGMRTAACGRVVYPERRPESREPGRSPASAAPDEPPSIRFSYGGRSVARRL